MMFFFKVRLRKAFREVSLDSIAAWANLPNVYIAIQAIHLRTVNFFVTFSGRRSICSVSWVDVSVESLNFL